MKKYLLVLTWSVFLFLCMENVLAASKTYLGKTYIWYPPDQCSALYDYHPYNEAIFVSCTNLGTRNLCPTKKQVGTYLGKPIYQHYRWAYYKVLNRDAYDPSIIHASWRGAHDFYFENHPAFPNGQWLWVEGPGDNSYVSTAYSESQIQGFLALPPVPFPCPEPCTGSKALEVVNCALKHFERKFPFDIFGFLPPTRVLTCPTLVFLEKTFQICWIYDYIAAFKYPVIASLLIQLFIKI